MIGSLRWNIVLGAVGFGLTFALSVGHNFIARTLLNSAYGFLILFVVGFALRWTLGTLVGLKAAAPATEEEATETTVGTAVDAATPEDREQLNELIKEQLHDPAPADAFKPLAPKRLASVSAEDAEQLAKALRRVTEE